MKITPKDVMQWLAVAAAALGLLKSFWTDIKQSKVNSYYFGTNYMGYVEEGGK